MNPTHLINLLYQQILSDQLQKNIQDSVLVSLDEEFFSILEKGNINNWQIVLDIMGFPDENDLDFEVYAENLYEDYYKILKSSFSKTKDKIMQDLYYHYELLKDILEAYNTDNQKVLDSFLEKEVV